jgi:hypothetical protein
MIPYKVRNATRNCRMENSGSLCLIKYYTAKMYGGV